MDFDEWWAEDQNWLTPEAWKEVARRAFRAGRDADVPSATVLSTHRHPDWERASREFRRENPRCAATGSADSLEVHHVLPYHKFPDLEMERTNWIVLTRAAHFWLGHYGDWMLFNINIRGIAAASLAARRDGLPVT